MTVTATTTDKGTTPDSQAGVTTQQEAPAAPTTAEPTQPVNSADAKADAGPLGVKLEPGAIPLEEGDGAEAGAEETVFDPDSYEFAFEDGLEPDPEAFGQFKTLAAEMKLPQEQAQKLVEWYQQDWRRQEDRRQNELKSHIERIYGEDLKACQALPEFEKVQSNAALALRHFATERDDKGRSLFIQSMRQCGMANNPHLFKFLGAVGAYLQEADAVASDASEPARDKSVAERLFKDFNP